MNTPNDTPLRRDTDPQETGEWVEAFEHVLAAAGSERASYLLAALHERAQRLNVAAPCLTATPYVNTIPPEHQAPYPGDRVLERRIKSIIRWNAMAMVVRANKDLEGIGGHISTYASAATLYEVGFNHFWRARTQEHPGDLVYFQGHASPGVYARAFLEGRLGEKELTNFRRELARPRGPASYPHPWLMPEFWQFPTVSMGLGPIMGIYQARFNRYLQDRGVVDLKDAKVWVMMGDGETDEPESLGAISLATREKLDNLIFVINANLQRLDGPVRGNGKIIQELETVFRGAGWNVIKVIWGGEWDALLAGDARGLLVRRMMETVDGQYQKYSVSSGDFIRKDFFGVDPELLALVADLSDEELKNLRRGGHDPEKVYAAYKAAVEHRGAPTVIIAKTIKGYGLGEAGEGKNVTHQQKKLNEEELRRFRSRFGIPLSDDEVPDMPFYRPPDDSPEIEYLRACRARLGGALPARAAAAPKLPVPPLEAFKEFLAGSGNRAVSTTMAFVRLLNMLLHDPQLGKHVVPIVPDEARTFGMEALFREFGIYSHAGQLYEPVDAQSLLFYREARDGRILEEGITEAGAMSSFIAAASAYATHGTPCIPFFIFYSMFGFQRIGDLIWAAGDMRCRGFLLGATSGRTTLNGEGLQHQDGHSHVLASTVPAIASYDPAFGYEIA
ncbi:MAG TPA: pyruvate dehydrogenase (acetyl-transferring), homodimeric type, partial [Planctomycetes bacterium]|nr:pyruvate dehydrogenase (acetyl-transferring), homodimeric type [Planctomycetota bacterium]